MYLEHCDVERLVRKLASRYRGVLSVPVTTQAERKQGVIKFREMIERTLCMYPAVNGERYDPFADLTHGKHSSLPPLPLDFWKKWVTPSVIAAGLVDYYELQLVESLLLNNSGLRLGYVSGLSTSCNFCIIVFAMMRGAVGVDLMNHVF